MGNGYEILLQGFNWESHRENWYQVIRLPGLVHNKTSARMRLYMEPESCCVEFCLTWGLLILQVLKDKAGFIANSKITAVWLPPPSDSVSPQGYLPRDLYNLNSAYGSEGELRECLNTLHDHNLKAIADIVINHRCAHFQVCDHQLYGVSFIAFSKCLLLPGSKANVLVVRLKVTPYQHWRACLEVLISGV